MRAEVNFGLRSHAPLLEAVFATVAVLLGAAAAVFVFAAMQADAGIEPFASVVVGILAAATIVIFISGLMHVSGRGRHWRVVLWVAVLVGTAVSAPVAMTIGYAFWPALLCGFLAGVASDQ